MISKQKIYNNVIETKIQVATGAQRLIMQVRDTATSCLLGIRQDGSVDKCTCHQA